MLYGRAESEIRINVLLTLSTLYSADLTELLVEHTLEAERILSGSTPELLSPYWLVQIMNERDIRRSMDSCGVLSGECPRRVAFVCSRLDKPSDVRRW